MGQTLLRTADDMVMVGVPGGKFQTGRDNTTWHTATVDGFWIDKFELTNAQYWLCVGADACELPANINSKADMYALLSTIGNYPVVNVSITQAKIYCEWAGSRLPTEEEWSYAARGPNSYSYPWGDSFDPTRLNFCDVNCTSPEADKTTNDGYATTAPVGTYPRGASWCGALDMSGNVWDMVSNGVVLGGSWYSRAANARTGSGYDFGGGGMDYGFRCAANYVSGTSNYSSLTFQIGLFILNGAKILYIARNRSRRLLPVIIVDDTSQDISSTDQSSVVAYWP